MVAAAFLDRCFCVSERGSSVGTEVRAGITTFVTMAYILVVNPTIMATAGLPFKAAAFATAATAIVGSGFVSVFANLPFGLAPGMGLNAYFAYGVCIARDIPVGVALAIMCGVGLSFGILSALGACSLLQQVMPNNLKYATTVAIGVFQAFIGFRMVNLVVGNKDTLVTLGAASPPFTPPQLSTPSGSSGSWTTAAWGFGGDGRPTIETGSSEAAATAAS